jgi:DNA processing protein
MNNSISNNTQAILLLTAPLIVGRGDRSSELLTPTEYNRVARCLHDNQHEPADLLSPEADRLLNILQTIVDSSRISKLLGRGFLLTQAVERWQARAIWVISRADSNYPKKLKNLLKDSSPALLYGAGDETILETGGLAIVGSRDVNDEIIRYTENISKMAARAHQTVISGGARGIDRAAMFGALQNEGHVIGVLADSLERMVLAPDNRDHLMEKRLVLISPYDPLAGFDVGHAMQRNKIIYALSNAALIANTDFEKGGTWSGAVEQLEKLHLVPVYIRWNENPGKGLKALEEKGASPWPNPETPEEFAKVYAVRNNQTREEAVQEKLPLLASEIHTKIYESVPNQTIEQNPTSPGTRETAISPEDVLFSKAKALIQQIDMPITVESMSRGLHVARRQTTDCLKRLVDEKILILKLRPKRYIIVNGKQENLFDGQKRD